MNNHQLIVFFDGDCSFCNYWVHFIIKRDSKRKFSFAELESDTAQDILKNYPEIHHHDSVFLLRGNRLYSMSDAALRICEELNFPTSLLYSFIIIPAPIRNWVYNFIANRRKRMNYCSVSPEEQQEIKKRMIHA